MISQARVMGCVLVFLRTVSKTKSTVRIRVFFSSRCGTTGPMLNFESYGSPNTPRLLVIHGLFGSGRNWRAIAKRLSADFHVTTVDMRNHGNSFWSDEMDYPSMASDLAEVIEATGPSSMVLGHSMGGKAAMVLALTRPDLVERLIVADIAPVTYTHTQTPFIDAMKKVNLSKIQKRSDVSEALKEHVDDASLQAFFAQSIDMGDQGARWLLNLEVLRKSMPDIIGFPDISGQYDGRTLFIFGANSDYVDEEGRTAIAPLFPTARFAKLKNAGHWLHAEQPRPFIEVVQGFCNS